MIIESVNSLARRMLLVGFCLLVQFRLTSSSEALGRSVSAGTIVYGTVVERDSGQAARLPNAVLTFLGSNGTTKTVEADKNGEYSVQLSSGQNYSLTVSSKSFCPAHRPPFSAQPGRKARFDVELTVFCPNDVVSSGPDLTDSDIEGFCVAAGVYYCEQRLTLDRAFPVTIVITFAQRRDEPGSIFSFSSDRKGMSPREQSGNLEYPRVLVAFDTFSIRAKKVTLDRRKEILIARGNVSITHDAREVSVGSPCVSIHFGGREPAVRSCD
jgi:hypothetical protein